MFIRRMAVLAAIPVLLLPLSLRASTVHKTKQFGEPRPDKALVYVIREKAFVGGGVGIFVFADEQLIAFVRNSTYSFGYVDPGLHLVWGDTPSGLDVQFIAGETYYLGARPVNPITLMTEAEGKKAIEAVASFIESDQKDLDNAAKKVAKRYEKVQKREARKVRADVESVAVAPPSSTEGMVKLPANTKLEIELMENLSSSLNTMGETVWFRVVSGVIAEGNEVIPRGARVRAAIRQVKKGTSFGEQGMLDVAVISVDLDEKTRIPLIGQLAAAGEDRAAGVMTGILVGAFIKGTEAFHAAGTKYSAWTRDEVWLQPASSTAGTPHSGMATSARDFVFGANTRRAPPPLELSFPCAGDASEVEIVAAGDWQLAEPVKAVSSSRSGGTCTARFSGWSVLRHVRGSETALALHLHARVAETLVHVDIPSRIRLE